jgi:hypothetical protein
MLVEPEAVALARRELIISAISRELTAIRRRREALQRHRHLRFLAFVAAWVRKLLPQALTRTDLGRHFSR